jgi:hypothetical protein
MLPIKIPILFIFFQNRYKLVIIIYIAVFAEVNKLNKAEKSCLTYYNKFRSEVTRLPRNKSLKILKQVNARQGRFTDR